MQDLLFLSPLREGPWWHGMSPTTLRMDKQTSGSEGATQKDTYVEVCAIHFKINSVPPSLAVFNFKTITVSKNCSQNFHLCNKWRYGFKRVMHRLSPTPTAIYGRAPNDARGSRIREVGNYFENQMEKISEPHLLFLSPPLFTHPHPYPVVKQCTNWFCVDKTTLREVYCHNLI